MIIQNLKELIPYLDELDKDFEHISSKVDKNQSREQFRASLIANLKNGSEYFGQMDNENLVYFFAINQSQLAGYENEACCWIMYIGKNYREKTKNLLSIMFDKLKKLGFSKIKFISSNTTPSYNRWISKFARKSLIIYERQLN